MEREMRMSDTDKVSLNPVQPVLPGCGIVCKIFVHRIARRSMHEMKGLTAEDDGLGDRKPHEKFVMGRIENPLMKLTCGSRQLTAAAAVCSGDPLSGGVVVIAADSGMTMLADPFDTRNGIGPVFDEVPEKEARIERFPDRRQCDPVRVDVSQQQDFHRPPRAASAAANSIL